MIKLDNRTIFINISKSLKLIDRFNFARMLKRKFIFTNLKHLLPDNDILTNSFIELKAHKEAVTCLIVLPEGHLASVCKWSVVVVWDKDNFNIKSSSHDLNKNFEGNPWHSKTFSIILNVFSQCILRVYKMFNTHYLSIVDYPRKHIIMENKPLAFLLLPDKRVALADEGGFITIFCKNLKENSQTLKAHELDIYSLVNLTENCFASASGDKTIKLWQKMKKGYFCLKVLTGHLGAVFSLCHFERFLISGSADQCINIWDGSLNHSCVNIIKGHRGYILALAQIDNYFFASGSTDNTIKIWDFVNQRCIRTLEGHKGCIYSLAVLNDYKLASASGDKTIRIWDIYLENSCK
jgi:WD40 repeat protein